ncbi:Thiolase protein [Pyrenophora tritici-repentis]|nr:Thiolase protein [Pyrenophora tritici-repentis]
MLFTFTGQGAQYAGMGATLYQTLPYFRQLLDSYEQHCQSYGLGFLNLITQAEDATLASGQFQVAIAALEMALASYLMSLGLQPDFVIGHSIGEYAALFVAGVLSAYDVLWLLHHRARLLEQTNEAGTHGMLSVNLPALTIQKQWGEECEISCYNTPNLTVVSAPMAHILDLEAKMKNSGTRVSRLNRVGGAGVFPTPRIPVASTVLGRIVNPGEAIFDACYLARHTRQAVEFVAATQACEDNGLITDDTVIVEIGPHPTSIGLLQASLRAARPTAVATLQRGKIDWYGISTCLAVAHDAGKKPIGHGTQDKHQQIRIEARLDRGSKQVSVNILAAEGDAPLTYATGQIAAATAGERQEWSTEWTKIWRLVEYRSREIESMAFSEKCMLNQKLFYHMFAEIVNYGNSYRTIREASIAGHFCDAVATFQFESCPTDAYACNPFMVDNENPIDIIHSTISAATGLSVREIHGGKTFGDLGIDSQLSISIMASLKRTTGIELAASLFAPTSSILDVQRELEVLLPTLASATERVREENKDVQASSLELDNIQNVSNCAVLLRIVACALGIETDELHDSSNVAISWPRLHAKYFKFSQFFESRLVSSSRRPFSSSIRKSAMSADNWDHAKTKSTVITVMSARPSATHPEDSGPTSRAILLQGSAQSQDPPLFLLTDGSGTVEAYVHLDKLPNGRRT